MFDTGSSSAWAVDAKCGESCPNYSGYARLPHSWSIKHANIIDSFERKGYDVEKSSTGKLTGEDASIDYLGGRVAGHTVTDVFESGDVSWNGSFIAANESNWFALPAHGFLGLAFGSIADGGAAPLFEDMMANKVVDEPRFGIYYARDEVESTGGVPGKGLLTLGASREDKYVDGELTTVPLLQRNGGYDVWRTVLFSATGGKTACNGTKIESKTDMSWSDVVFDTGASSVSLPPDQIESVYASIGMNWTAIINGQHIPLCSEFTDKWSITFEIGFYGESKNLTLTGDQLALPGFANRDDACWPPFDDSGSYGFSLIGTRLLRNFYTVWDYGSFPTENPYYQPTLSFGKLKPGL